MQTRNVLNKSYHTFVAYTPIRRLGKKKKGGGTEETLEIVLNFPIMEKYAGNENAHNHNIAHEIS